MASAGLAPLPDPAVSWSEDALEQLRRRAVDGLLALPIRGIEIGGLLLGVVSEQAPYRFSIEAIAPIECEHQQGPGFVLSENDRLKLVALLAEIQGYGVHSVVGYYRSRTAREAGPELDAADLELIGEFFAGQSHVFLALRPWSVRRCEAALYRWSAGLLVSTGERFELGERPPPQAPVVEEVPSDAASQPRQASRREQAHVPDAPRRSEQFWKIATLSLAVLAGFLMLPRRGSEPVRNAVAEQTGAPAVALPPTQSASETARKLEPRRTDLVQLQPPATTPVETITQRAVALELLRPSIPESIRNRISHPVTVRVLVLVDDGGRVISARPAEYSDGLQRYVAQQAAKSAQAIRFRPAISSSGRAVPAYEDLTYTFEPR